MEACICSLLDDFALEETNGGTYVLFFFIFLSVSVYRKLSNWNLIFRLSTQLL